VAITMPDVGEWVKNGRKPDGFETSILTGAAM
jgi:hypothetical protein